MASAEITSYLHFSRSAIHFFRAPQDLTRMVQIGNIGRTSRTAEIGMWRHRLHAFARMSRPATNSAAWEVAQKCGADS